MSLASTPRFPLPEMSAWEKAAAKSAPGAISRRSTGSRPKVFRSSPLHRSRHQGPRVRRYPCLEWSLTCVARRRPCTRSVRGPSASTRASPRPRLRTPSTARRWQQAARGLGGIRPGDPPRLRFGQSARAGRCRQGRRGNRFGRGHEDPLRRHSRSKGLGLDDHERCRAADSRGVHRRRRRAGRVAGQARGPSRTTSSRSSWSATPTSIRRRRR